MSPPDTRSRQGRTARAKGDACPAPLGDAGPVEQTDATVRVVDRVLGPDHIGSYLHGSAVLAGLRPASDVDILTVAARSLDEGQRRALVAGILPLSGSRVGARPVELTVVVASDVRPWSYPPTGDFLYAEWLRDDYEAGVVPRPEPMPGLAIEITVALAGDHALHGPPPAEVLDPVPVADLARASVDGLPGLLADLPGDTRNVLLTLARCWATLATGTIMPKDAAADWALPRLPPEHRPPLDHARRLYRTSTYAGERWSDELRARVGPCADELLARVRALTTVDP
jgi:streptomycin 3"-adenylyltransferase